MEQDLQLIDDYLAGRLDAGQRSAFETRLQTDSQFAEVYKRERSMQAFLTKENKKAALIPQLEALGEKHFGEEDASGAKVVGLQRRRLLRGLSVAAAVALLVVAVRLFLIPTTLYEEYAIHQPLSLLEKSDNVPIAAAAEVAFNRADYELAYDLLDQYLQVVPADTKVLLAQGVSALELQRYEASANIFNQIHEGNTALKYQGTWYLALQNLKQDRAAEAAAFLKQIPASEGNLYDKAIELLAEIQNE